MRPIIRGGSVRTDDMARLHKEVGSSTEVYIEMAPRIFFLSFCLSLLLCKFALSRHRRSLQNAVLITLSEVERHTRFCFVLAYCFYQCLFFPYLRTRYHLRWRQFL
jgi:hypothetical protein